MVLPEWLTGYKVVTPEQIRRLPPGTVIIIHGSDRHGEHYTIRATIAQSGKKKVFAIWANDERRTRAIKETPGLMYTLEWGKGI